MNAIKKTTRQTFVTLRRFAAAAAVLVEGNRLASATPATTPSEQICDFKTKYGNSGRKCGLFRGITKRAWTLA
jgi:hypothetical protein